MRLPLRTLPAVALLLASVSLVRAQSAVNLSGHWQGNIQVQSMDVPVGIDIATNAKGGLFGTLSQPAQKIRGLPLSSVAIDGRTVTFVLMSGSTFSGTLAADGKTIAGELASVTVGTVSVTLTRTGDARIDAPPKNAAITREMEGTWTGTIAVDNGFRVVLKMANQSDGTSSGTLVSLDEGGVAMPVAITQNGSTLTLDIRTIGASFSGALNAAGTELAGTYRTAQGAEVPLTLQRAAADVRK
jgi:hypothetical protein